jgi:hypothetical protein
MGPESDLLFEGCAIAARRRCVHAPALAARADRDLVPLEGAGEVVGGELTALVGIEDLILGLP